MPGVIFLMKGEFTMSIKQSQALFVVLKLLFSTLNFAFSIVCITFAIALITVILYGSFTGVIVPY